MIKRHVSGPEGLLDLIPILREGALVLGVQIGLDIWSHVGPGQPDHILVPTLVLVAVVHHTVHPVEEVIGWGVFPVEGLGSLVLGSRTMVVLIRDGRGSGGPGSSPEGGHLPLKGCDLGLPHIQLPPQELLPLLPPPERYPSWGHLVSPSPCCPPVGLGAEPPLLLRLLLQILVLLVEWVVLRPPPLRGWSPLSG